MSHQDKIKICILFSLLFLFYSCKEKNKSEYFSKYLEVSTQIIGTNNYKNLYGSIIDSANNWNRNKLNGWINYKLNENVAFDSLLCFNKEKNKFITAILSKSFYTRQQIVEDDIGNGEMDALHFFYGVNIDNKWYFFDGATCYLPRKMYRKDTHTPLSFSKLHEIALEEVFSGYLIKKKKDVGWWNNLFSPEYEYEVNDDFFKYLNIPLVPFSERKSNPNCPFSCRVIDNEKEYAECLLKKQALSIWNEERAFIKSDTYLYAPELPIGEKVISKINKNESFKVLEYIDNTEWVYVRMSAHNPNLGLIHKNEISRSKL